MAFAVVGVGSAGALAIAAAALSSPRTKPSSAVLDFRSAFRNRAVRGYTGSFLAIAWEVFASRIWLMTSFVFLADRAPGGDILLSAAAWATAVALAGPPRCCSANFRFGSTGGGS